MVLRSAKEPGRIDIVNKPSDAVGEVREDSPDTLLRRADLAVSRAKSLGRGRVAHYADQQHYAEQQPPAYPDRYTQPPSFGRDEEERRHGIEHHGERAAAGAP